MVSKEAYTPMLKDMQECMVVSVSVGVWSSVRSLNSFVREFFFEICDMYFKHLVRSIGSSIPDYL